MAKIAIYIEDGLTQIVVTPETDFEKNALKNAESDKLEAKIFHGSFYDCRGGWVRQKDVNLGMFPGSSRSEDNSLIVTFRQKDEGEPTTEKDDF